MRKIFIAATVCVYIAGSAVLGRCQDDNAIEQSESQLGEGLESEISSEQAEGTTEQKETNAEFDAGEPMTY